MSAVGEAAERLAKWGVCVHFLCGPGCDWERHGHARESCGKVPLLRGWSRAGFTDPTALAAVGEANLGILTGWQPTARVSLVPVDLDSQAALRWAMAHLPTTPIRAATRRGEHWYYRAAGPTRPRNFRFLEPALDMEVIADGRQVVAPPSTHGSGSSYAEVEPWTLDALASVPDFSESWFSGFTRGGVVPPDGGSATRATTADTRWPTDRTRSFSPDDLDEARERCAAYLSSRACPVSVSGSGGDQVLYEVAVKVVRGFPLASAGLVEGARARGATQVLPDAQDALSEAARLMSEHWNHRCLDADGSSPYPWDEDRIWYKVGQAAQADRLPGPDYWLFDEPDRRRRWAEAHPSLENGEAAGVSAPAASRDVERIVTCDIVTQPSGGVKGELSEDEQVARRRAEGAAFAADAARFAGLGEAVVGNGSGDGEGSGDGGAVDLGECEIPVSNDVLDMAERAQTALARIADIYVKDGKLCDLVRECGQDEHGYRRRPWLRETPRAHLIALLARHAKWVKESANGARSYLRPDGQAVSALMVAGTWPDVRVLNGITYVPVVRRDGTVLQREGYDPATRLLYVDELGLDPVQEQPTRAAVGQAMAYLLDVVRDFPFADPDRARAVWLSAVLTRFCRAGFSGNVPMFAVSGNVAGAGKGKLVDAAATICDGRPADKIAYTGDVDEDNRVILAHLIGGTPSVCLDNIPRGLPLASSAFEAMLTAPSFGARVIGTSKFHRAAFNDTIWWATGNGMETGGDMSRRVLRVDVEDATGAPAARAVSRLELERYCLDRRHNLIRAALTVLRGWHAAGSPRVKLAPLASYEEWSAVVRQCVVWCGLPDPALSVGKVSDDSVGSAREFVVVHMQSIGTHMASELCGALASNRGGASDKYASLRTFLSEAAVKFTDGGVSLGKYLKAHVSQPVIVDGRRLTLRKRATNAGTRYWVDDVPPSPHVV